VRRRLILIACVLGLVACSSEYVISTRDGGMIVTDSKPKLDDDIGMYRYHDQEGREGMIKKEQVVQILER